MCPRTAAVLLLLVLQACAHRTDDKRNLSEEVRARRHDGEERPSSGRRWTTSRNSPYQKIVSSYEQEVPEEQQVEDPAQAKEKTQKRKQWRTSAASHDQIGSETSFDDKVPTEEPTDSEAPRGKPAVPSRRRSAPSHSREGEEPVDQSSSVPKKRRGRPATTSTTTAAPQTMSDSLYQYFRPLERDVPQDDIMPFLDFGRKLAPVIPTPSGANSIEGRSRITKLRSRHHHEDRGSYSPDDEMLQEDMDVTVVKTAIERNSVPRAKLRVREQGISDYYRKRVPPQVRTTENLISTSDSSTASSVPGPKSILAHKKLHRHQIHNEGPIKIQEHMSQAVSSEVESPHQLKSVEYIPEKRRQMLRPVQKLAAIKLESSQSPLTAESTVVKTIIKDPSLAQSKEDIKSETAVYSLTLDTTPLEKKEEEEEAYSTLSDTSDFNSTLSPEKANLSIHQVNENDKPKILSTAVVTSVSVQESLDASKHHVATETPVETTTNKITNNPIPTSDQLSLAATGNRSTSSSRPPFRNYISSSNFTNSTANNSEVAVTTNRPNGGVRSQTWRTETLLRSREIYRPKAIVPGGPIPHLPRQIPTSRPANTTGTPQEVQSSTASLENSTIKSAKTPSTIERTSLTTQKPSTSTTTESTPPPTTVARTTTTPPQTITTYKPTSTTTPPALPNNRTEVAAVTNENATVFPPTTEVAFIEKKEGIVKEPSSAGSIQPAIEKVEDILPSNPPHFVEDLSSHTTESESVPPPKRYEEPMENLTFVPIEPSYPKEDHVDQFPIYFTTLPSATIPVVDTRPETEAAIVEEQRNTTTPRPAPDWVKIGAVEKDVEVVYPEPLGLGAYALAALGVIPIVMGALIAARFILAHSKKKVLDESEYSSEYNRSPLGINASSPMPTKLPRITTHVSWSEVEKSAVPVSSSTSATSSSARWEFQRDKLRLQTLLGEGNFGQVWKAEADDIAGHEGLTRLVAVKTVKESATNREREDLLRELGIMQELGSHPNVVTLLGCCTEKEPIYLIMEYVMYGKLLSFLRDHRTRAHYYNFSDATDALTSRDLTVFAYCVARGMDYLTNKSIIHRDLAARNVLVDHNKLCKIADFGMSRNVRDTGQIYEQRQSKGALPIRWMAPESLHFSLFTHKTDVWSFGILMWEIVTLGSTPYATMGAREVMRRVRDGYRLERPGHCRPELFRVITQCWHSEPSKRPTFAELKVELGALLNDSQLRGSFVDLDSYADEMRRDSLHRHH